MIGSRLGPYHLLAELGSGGMGKVYRAEVVGKAPGLELGSAVALKVIHGHLLETPGFFKRFLREADIGRTIEHENVVRTFDCDALLHEGIQQNFLVMEYVEGQTLRSLLREVEPFPTTDLVPYDTAYLSGFVVEHYQVVLNDAARQSREVMEDKLYQMCASQVPGDTYRNLHIEPSYSGETFKHILAPVWLLAYNYGRKSYQVIVNGYTGKTAGEYPKSVWKIVVLVLLAIIVVVIALRFAS